MAALRDKVLRLRPVPTLSRPDLENRVPISRIASDPRPGADPYPIRTFSRRNRRA